MKARARSGALLLAISTLLCLAGAELALRCVAARRVVVLESGPKPIFNPYRPDAQLSYALRPDWSGVLASVGFRVSVHINEQGMRGAAHSATKLPGVMRVLVLGDSYAFGWGVEDDESFAERLARSWRSEGRAVEVRNAAVPGYSADQHWIFLRERGFSLAPDAILLALSQNDADDLGWSRPTLGPDLLPLRTESLRRFIDQDGRMHYLNESRLPIPERTLPFSGWLAERSRLYEYLRYNLLRAWLGAAERLASRARTRAAGAPPEAPIASLPAAEIERGLRTGEAFQLRYHAFLVDAIRREAARRGIAFAVVLAGPDRGPLSDSCARDPACLDLSLRIAAPSQPEAFLPLDGHWSAEGHRRAAEAIAGWLRERDFPPAARP